MLETEKYIYGNRNDTTEESICGKCMAGHEDVLPCIREGSSFMSPRELAKSTIIPYKRYNSQVHQHFLETEVTYPPYSFLTKLFARMMKDRIETIYSDYGIENDSKVYHSGAF